MLSSFVGEKRIVGGAGRFLLVSCWVEKKLLKLLMFGEKKVRTVADGDERKELFLVVCSWLLTVSLFPYLFFPRYPILFFVLSSLPFLSVARMYL